MYARLTTIVFEAPEADLAGSLFEQILPIVREFDGFKGLLMLAGMDDGHFAALTLWSSAEALAAAEPTLEGIKQAETAHRAVKSKQTVRYYVAGSSLDT